jgi:hypothetical protein
MERIDTVVPGVAEELKALDLSLLRRVAEAAAREAMRARPLHDRRAEAALKNITDRRYGATPEREAVQALADELDEEYWELEPPEDVAAREPFSDERLEAFARARVASTLWSALDPDPRAAALEALYEAWAATGQDGAVVRAVIDRAK